MAFRAWRNNCRRIHLSMRRKHSSMLKRPRQFSWTGVKVRAWMINYIPYLTMNVIPNQRSNFRSTINRDPWKRRPPIDIELLSYALTEIELCRVIIHIYHNFNDGLTKPPLTLGHGWLITPHITQRMWLFIHAYLEGFITPVDGRAIGCCTLRTSWQEKDLLVGHEVKFGPKHHRPSTITTSWIACRSDDLTQNREKNQSR